MTKQIPLSQGKLAIIDNADFEYLNQWKWSATKDRNTWYAVRINKNGKKILMHREIVNAPDGMKVDHRNGDGLFNLRENLRVCTNAQNGQNRRINKNNTSGFKGVHWEKNDNRWRARIKINYRAICLGSFKTAEAAALAYDEAAKKYFGEFAATNF